MGKKGKSNADMEPDRPDLVAADGTKWEQGKDTRWRSSDTDEDDPPYNEAGAVAADHGPVYVDPDQYKK